MYHILLFFFVVCTLLYNTWVSFTAQSRTERLLALIGFLVINILTAVLRHGGCYA
jgi:hypothetical protein